MAEQTSWSKSVRRYLARILTPGITSFLGKVTLAVFVLTVLGIRASAQRATGKCGPPTYLCSRTDAEVTQPDSRPSPNLGGVTGSGTVARDPLYNNVMLTRCTDARTDPNNDNASYFAGQWNEDDTLVAVGNTAGATLLMRVNMANHTCRPVFGDSGNATWNSGYFGAGSPISASSTFYLAQYPNNLSMTPLTINKTKGPAVLSSIPAVDFHPALYTGTLPAWPGANQAVSIGTVIKPIINNPNGYMFQAISTGTTNLIGEPSWNRSVPPFLQQIHGGGSRIIDNNVIWKNIDVKNSGSPYVQVGGIRGSGDRYIGESFSFGGGQDTGVFAAVYDRVANKIYQYNTFTGIETDYTCSGGHGYNCSGGKWSAAVVNTAPSSQAFLWHNNALSLDGQVLQMSVAYCFACAPNTTTEFWKPGTGTVTPMTSEADGHPALGYSHYANGNGDSASYYKIRPLSDLNTIAPIWNVKPCTDTNASSPPYAHPPCFPQLDSHLSWTYNQGQDQEPIIGAVDLGFTPYEYPATSPWQWEVVGVSVCGSGPMQPSCPSGYPANTVWRFARTLNFSTDSGHGIGNFYAAISQTAISPTGKLVALTTTNNGSFGSDKGTSTCFAGYAWSASYNYPAGKTITPNDFNGGNAQLYAFQTESECTSGKKEPLWSQNGASRVTDNTCKWTPVGRYNCRSDVVIVTLQ